MKRSQESSPSQQDKESKISKIKAFMEKAKKIDSKPQSKPNAFSN
jgi:hypothetical protein